MAVLHGASHKAIKYMNGTGVLAVFWLYVSRTNGDGVAWPSVRGLVRDSGYSYNTVAKARKLLVEHGAIERVYGYFRPEWRELTPHQRTQKVNIDRSEYYRVTGVWRQDGQIFPLLYFPAMTPSDIEDGILPDDSQSESSEAPMTHVVHQAPRESELVLRDTEITNVISNAPEKTNAASDEFAAYRSAIGKFYGWNEKNKRTLTLYHVLRNSSKKHADCNCEPPVDLAEFQRFAAAWPKTLNAPESPETLQKEIDKFRRRSTPASTDNSAMDALAMQQAAEGAFWRSSNGHA